MLLSYYVQVITKRGGFLPDATVFNFDAPFFRVSPREAEMMDPQHRLLLRFACACLLEGGVNAQRLPVGGWHVGGWLGV